MRARTIRRTIAMAGVVVAAGAAARDARAQGAATQGAATPPLLVQVTGTVYDSIAHAPLVGAQVQLVDATNQVRTVNAVTDSSGTFHVAVAPGRYLAGFFHPALDVLGIEPPIAAVTIPAGPTATIGLGVPGSAAVMRAVCGARQPNDSSGMIVGFVRDANTGAPVPGARVVLTWTEITIGGRGLQSEQRRVPAVAREDGTYAICGAPNDRLVASADSGSRHTGLIQVDVPLAGVVRRDFTLGDAASAVGVAMHADSGAATATVLRGQARLAGVVRASNGHAVARARVTVWGTGLTGTTGEDGRFSIDSLPAGTFSVEARALGFTPTLEPVDLASQRTSSITLHLEPPATRLSSVTVYGKRSTNLRNIDDFLERRKNGFGHYLTAVDLQHKLAITDALRTVPGLHVGPSQGGGEAVYGRGGCTPVVYMDGMQIFDGSQSMDTLLQPSDVMGVEVYTGLGGVPPQYQSNGCGVILLWSRR